MKAFVGGPSESGKSTALRALFTSRHPRVISIEQVPEAHKHNPDVIRAFGFAELKDALLEATRPEWRRWHIAWAPRELAEVVRLARLLVPQLRSEATRSIAQVVGGIAVECHELSEVAPSGKTPAEIRRLYVQGRHYLVSLLSAAQRPALVDRCATSEANVLMSLRAHETNDVKWWAATTSPDVAQLIRRLREHHSIWYRPRAPIVYELDRHYRVCQRISLLEEAAAS